MAATSELSQRIWTGRSIEGRPARAYRLIEGEGTRQGRATLVLPVRAEGPALEPGAPAEGVKLALKVFRGGDPLALRGLRREARIQVGLSRDLAEPPCPRVYDRVGTDEAPGLAVEWCGSNLERWWVNQCREPDAIAALLHALAEIAGRLIEYRGWLVGHEPEGAPPPDLRPSALLRGGDGRWLLARFRAFEPAAPIEEGTSRTEVLPPADHFIAPEVLFQVRLRHPTARDTWSIGAALLSLLKLRAVLISGATFPAGGTNGLAFRSHRALLVSDLHHRKPNLFAGRDLDPRQFLYPDRLPDPDRRVVQDSLSGAFGEPQAALEGQLGKEVCALLDRALAVDPGWRYQEPAELQRDLERLARRFHELKGELLATRRPSPPLDSNATALLSPDGLQAALLQKAELDSARDDLGRALERIAALETRVARLGDRQAPAAPPAARPVRAPAWVPLALGGVLLLGLFNLTGLTVLLLTRGSDAPQARPSPVDTEPRGAVPEGGGAEPAAAQPPITPPPSAKPTGSTERSAPKASAGATDNARPTSARAPSAPSAPAGSAAFEVVGGSGYLLAGGKRIGPGAVPPGTYEVFAQVGEAAPSALGTVTLTEGGRLRVRCGFGQCRIEG